MSEEYSIGYARGYEAGQQSVLKLAEQPAQQQEPVAEYIGECNDGSLVQLYDDVKKGAKFYTSPPASKPLTDEQRLAESLQRHGMMLVKTATGYDVLKLGRVVGQITAHGIKGDA